MNVEIVEGRGNDRHDANSSGGGIRGQSFGPNPPQYSSGANGANTPEGSEDDSEEKEMEFYEAAMDDTEAAKGESGTNTSQGHHTAANYETETDDSRAGSSSGEVNVAPGMLDGAEVVPLSSGNDQSWFILKTKKGELYAEYHRGDLNTMKEGQYCTFPQNARPDEKMRTFFGSLWANWRRLRYGTLLRTKPHFFSTREEVQKRFENPRRYQSPIHSNQKHCYRSETSIWCSKTSIAPSKSLTVPSSSIRATRSRGFVLPMHSKHKRKCTK